MTGTRFQRDPADPRRHYFVHNSDDDSGPVPGLYDLNGPLGNVSFHSQQRRAFYVASMVADFLSSDVCPTTANKNVLIIGAGLSGATCYLALKALGVEKIVLAEIATEPFTKQSQASHRYAHPSLAEWPLTTTFNSTTNLPFLNWHSGSVKYVVEQIKSDNVWKRHFVENPIDDDLLFSTNITSVTPDKGAFKVGGHTVKSGSAIDGRLGMRYACVVFATGYQEYEGVAHIAGYWEVDQAKRATEISDKNLDRPLVVVGNGDGAIIELGNIFVQSSKIETILVKLVSELRGGHARTFDDPTVSGQSDFEKEFKFILESDRSSPEKYDIRIRKALVPSSETITSILTGQAQFNHNQSKMRAYLVSRQHPFVSNKCSPISLLSYTLMLDKSSHNYWGTDNNRIELKVITKNYTEEDDLELGADVQKKPNYFFRHYAKTKIGLFAYENPEERNTDIGLGESFIHGPYKDALKQGTYYFRALGRTGEATPNEGLWIAYKLGLAKKYCDVHFDGSEVVRRRDKTFVYLDFEKHKQSYRNMGGFDFELHGETVHYRELKKLTRIVSGEVSDKNEKVAA